MCAGRTSRGVTLDGVDAHIAISFANMLYGGAISVETTVRWMNAFNIYARVFDCGNGQSDNIIIHTDVAGGGPASLIWLVRQGTTAQYQHGGSVTLGTRHHIVTTVDGSTMRTWINGVLSAEKTDGGEPGIVLFACS